jgi:hypothetical protein
MGGKRSDFFQADRPESGGANRDDIKDKSGLHEQDKQKLESHRAKVEEEGLIPKRGENPELERLRELREARERGDEEGD